MYVRVLAVVYLIRGPVKETDELQTAQLSAAKTFSCDLVTHLYTNHHKWNTRTFSSSVKYNTNIATGKSKMLIASLHRISLLKTSLALMTGVAQHQHCYRRCNVCIRQL